MIDFWNDRYAQDEFVYGTAPNVFFKQCLDSLSPGKILLPGDGEGRNAVYAASQGWEVEAFDLSTKARVKAERLAKQREVSIDYRTRAYQDYQINPQAYDAIGLIFTHMHRDSRSLFHQKLIESLAPGGAFIMEVFDKSQLGRTSGGPKQLDMLYGLEELERDFKSLAIHTLAVEDIHLEEGAYHQGEARVIRMFAVKPEATNDQE